jgi:hypothetical protein
MDERIAQYVRHNPADKHVVHKYHWEDTGLDYATERAKVRSYQEYFRVEAEF